MRARSLAYAAPALFLAACVGVFVWRHLYCLYDDAFIYLRYVRNIHAGCGLRFNCEDPPVEGFSSPIHLALVLSGSLVSTRLLLVSEIVSALALFGAGLLAIRTAARSFADPIASLAAAAILAAVLGLDPFFLLNAVIGMDAAVGALSAMLVFAAFEARPRSDLAPILAAVATLARPELLVFAALLPVFSPHGRRLRAAAIVFFVLAAIAVTRWTLFHDVVANTYWAKAGGTFVHAKLGAEYVARVALDFPFVLVAPLALLDRTRRRTAAFVLASSAVWCAFFLRTGGDTFAYSRLAIPLVPMLAVLSVRGAFALARRASNGRRAIAIAALPAAAATIFAITTHGIPPQRGFENVLAWSAAGRWLARSFVGQTVATVPIGAIGYYSKLRVVDLVGLTEPTIAKAGRTVPPELLTRQWIGHERHDLEHVAALRPAVIVTTKYRSEPWRSISEASAGFYADWLVLRAMKAGEMPYHVADAEVLPGVHWLLFVRDDLASGSPAGDVSR